LFKKAYSKEVVMKNYFATLPVLFFAAWPSFAADSNGYTAQYECRSGGPKCNVDVVALASQACQQTITSSTSPKNDWSAVNWSNDVICIQAGDHTARGTLGIQVSGTESKRKVLRYFRPNDTNDNPWKQDIANRAKIRNISINGAGYWIFDRLTVDGNGSSNEGIQLVQNSGVHHLILNRMLIQNLNSSLIEMHSNNGPEITVQNSVIRSTITRNDGGENMCIELGNVKRARIVNNEIYDCDKSISSGDGNNSILDAKIENNDLYVSSDSHTDCNGRYTPSDPNAACATTEAIVSLKSGGTASQPVEIIHNRFWGARVSDTTLIGGGNAGEAPAISISANYVTQAHYVLLLNNIIWDVQAGISNWWGTPNHTSIIGNIIYGVKRYHSYWESYAMRLHDMDKIEVYLNSIIGADATWLNFSSTVTNADIRCNVVVDSGPILTGGTGFGVQADDNVFFNTPLFEVNSQKRSKYFSNASDAKTGTYCFNSRLLTGPERVCIPNVVPTSASPHLASCPSSIGSRLDIGINDKPPY
jgi:hypothetical protein